MIIFAVQLVVLYALTFSMTTLVCYLWMEEFLMETKLGQRMQLLPKPFSCAACLSGWLSIAVVCFLAFQVGFMPVSFIGALAGGFFAARKLNSDIA